MKCGDRDCEMTNWSAWSTCPCGTVAEIKRTRSVHIPRLGNGKKCPKTTDVGECTMVKCDCKKMGKPDYYGNKCDKRDCKLGEWSSWAASKCKVIKPPRHHASAHFYEEKCSYNCPGSASRCTPTKKRSRGVATTKDGDGKDCSEKENRKKAVVFRASANVLILTLAKHVNTSNLKTKYLLCNATLLELITNFRIILHYFIIILVYDLFVF